MRNILNRSINNLTYKLSSNSFNKRHFFFKMKLINEINKLILHTIEILNNITQPEEKNFNFLNYILIIKL